MIAFATEARRIESPHQERPVMSRRPAALVERTRETNRLTRLRAGDEEACNALVCEYSGRVLAVARRMLRSEEDAADAVQDAFVSAFASIDRFRGGSSLYTWLHRIVVNACLMRLRSRRRRSEVSLDSLLPTFDESGLHSRPLTSWGEPAPHRLERREVWAAVRACIDQLPDEYRAILMLRDIEEVDTEETAKRLGLSQANVKTRLHRARQALRMLLRPRFADGEITARQRVGNRPAAVASN
jgi:RNA polymerase sigma-70 factor, ECF subfamily